MRRTYGKLVVAGLSLVLGLYGCSGSGSSESAPASDDEATIEESAPTEEEQEAEPTAATDLKSAELEVAGCDYHYELNEVSSFESESRITFQYDGVITFDGDSAQLVGLDGKPLLDGAAVKSIDYWADGIYMYTLDTNEVNNTGLVSMTDGVLVPAETAKLSYKTDKASDARFIEAIYATEETDNKDECFIFATDALFALSPGEDDIMYKGYAKVFDLKKGAFVDGVEIDNGSTNALHDLGDAFVVEGKDGVYTMYDESGKELWHSDSYPGFGVRSLATSSGGTYSIIDCTGKVSFECEDYLNDLTSTSDLYVLTDSSGAKYAIDSKGNKVLEGSYDKIISEMSGLFVVEVGDVAKIVDGKGTVLVDDLDGFSAKEELPGIISYKTNDGTYALYLSNGTAIDLGDDSAYQLIGEKDDKYLVIKDGTFSLEIPNSSELGLGLVKDCTDSLVGTYGLYDLFTGKRLLDSSYKSLVRAGDYIYASKDGKWTVYEAKLVQG